MTKIYTKYKNIIAEYEAQIMQDENASNKVGYTKLAVFPVLIICVVFLFTSLFALWAIIAVIVTIAVCVLLWVWHYRLDTKVSYARGIVAICKAHIARINGEWSKFDDIGQEFIDFEHPYACDLDIVGAKSLFQFLNTTHTWYGRQSFAQDLLKPQYNPQQIQERQEAIAELSGDINFANNIQYFLSQTGAKIADEKVVADLADNTPLSLSKLVSIVAYIPVATIILLIGGAIFQIRPLLISGISFVIAQAALCYFTRKTIGKYLAPMNRLPNKLGKYLKVIEALTRREFSSAKLNQINSKLKTAREAIRELEKISNKLSIQANPLVYFAFNTLLLWDLHCALLLGHWKKKYSHIEWFATIGEVESLLAFSNLPNVCSNTCLPNVTDTGKFLDAKALGHPLLSNENRVNNDLRLDDNIFIISGSNMSGKTTFMRTVGINLLLARAGSFVCAQEMTCTCFDIITSMRIADDLNEGVSTFYAELKKVKRIIDRAEITNPPVIFLIDEIFKGTNSVDRLAGADAVISKLAGLGAAGMISTHDLELCKLAEHRRILNHSFSEHYKNGKILFDYKIQAGQSKTTNARFLMEMLGIGTQ